MDVETEQKNAEGANPNSAGEPKPEKMETE